MCAVLVEGGLPTASCLRVRTQQSCLTLQPGNVVPLARYLPACVCVYVCSHCLCLPTISAYITELRVNTHFDRPSLLYYCHNAHSMQCTGRCGCRPYWEKRPLLPGEPGWIVRAHLQDRDLSGHTKPSLEPELHLPSLLTHPFHTQHKSVQPYLYCVGQISYDS